MDIPKRERAVPQGSPRRSPKAMRPGAATEADENATPRRLVVAGPASPQRTKVLGERNDGGGRDAAASLPAPPQPKPVPSPPSLTGRGAGAYDPKTNYTTPRPEFLRYDPERRREILLRVARAVEVEDDDCSSAASGTAASEAATASPVSSSRGRDSKAEPDDSDEDEEGEVTSARRGRWARRLFLLLVAVACSFCYICCMNPAPFPDHSEDGLDFVGPIVGMYDAGDHEVDSLRLLGPVYMMGPEDMLEEASGQTVHGDSEDVAHLYDQRASPRNLMAVAMMGLADTCQNVPLGELTCQIGGESSENMADLKGNSELDEHETEVVIGSFQNDDQSSKVGCLGGNTPLNSIAVTSGMQEGSSGLVHQEEGQEYSIQFVSQLVSMEKAVESASDKLDERKGSESAVMDLDTELWQYENTAEAARAICFVVRFLWSAMEPHLLHILACLSVSGFVAAVFKWFQRSREIAMAASQHVPSKSLVEVPVLGSRQIAHLPVSPSPQAVLLPVYSSQQPVQLTVSKRESPDSLEVPMQLQLPKSDPFVTLKHPVQLPLPKTELFVNLESPVIDRRNGDQKLQQGDAENMKASHGNSMDNIDSSKPPVVELLGEFTFANSSRERSMKNSKQHAGDAAVYESSESLGKHADKMQKNSSIVQSPSVRRARKEENAVKGEKTDVTLTSLRRSSRLRNKVTSP